MRRLVILGGGTAGTMVANKLRTAYPPDELHITVVDRDDELYPLPADNETLEVGDDCWILAPPAELTAFDPAVDEVASTKQE